MMNRISTAGNYQSALLNLMSAQARQADAQTRMSTQKNATDLAGFGRGSESLTSMKAAQSRVQGFVNAMALAASHYNATANALQVQILASDLLDDLPATPLAAIISNPPFHEGLNQTLAITERLVASSWLRLRPGGELRLVANRHLPYAELLAAQFGHFDVLAENNRFKVYRMVRGR